MKSDCKEFREHLPDVADGFEVPGIASHLESCDACSRELALLRQMRSAMVAPVFEPSEAAIQRAVDLMPLHPVRTARLVLGKLGLVRSAGAEEFQLVFEEEGLHARLMYLPLPDGWSITGRVDGDIRSVENAAGTIEVEPSGRFQFQVGDLRDTDLYVHSESGIIQIPAATEATADGTE